MERPRKITLGARYAQPSKRLHSFSSKGCGGDVHVVGNKANQSRVCFGRLQEPGGVQAKRAALRPARRVRNRKAELRARVSVSAQGVCDGQAATNPPLYRR